MFQRQHCSVAYSKGHTAPMFYYLFIIYFSRGTSYERSRRINFGGGSFDWKLEVVVPFLRVKNDRRAHLVGNSKLYFSF